MHIKLIIPLFIISICICNKPVLADPSNDSPHLETHLTMCLAKLIEPGGLKVKRYCQAQAEKCVLDHYHMTGRNIFGILQFAY